MACAHLIISPYLLHHTLPNPFSFSFDLITAANSTVASIWATFEASNPTFISRKLRNWEYLRDRKNRCVTVDIQISNIREHLAWNLEPKALLDVLFVLIESTGSKEKLIGPLLPGNIDSYRRPNSSLSGMFSYNWLFVYLCHPYLQTLRCIERL